MANECKINKWREDEPLITWSHRERLSNIWVVPYFQDVVVLGAISLWDDQQRKCKNWCNLLKLSLNYRFLDRGPIIFFPSVLKFSNINLKHHIIKKIVCTLHQLANFIGSTKLAWTPAERHCQTGLWLLPKYKCLICPAVCLPFRSVNLNRISEHLTLCW